MAVHPLLARGQAAERNGDYVSATAAYSAALSDEDSSVVGNAHFYLGRVAWRQSRHQDALLRYEKALALAEDTSDNDLWARAENGIGAIHYGQGEYAQARASYRVAYERSADDALRGKVLLNLGVIANIEADYDTARDHYQKSRELLARAGDDATLALVLHNLGMLHADLEQWDEAAEAYRHCLETSESNGDRQMIANVLVNRSELLCAREKFAQAVADCERAMMVYDELGDIMGRGEALRWQGVAYARQGDDDRALKVLEEAARTARMLKAELLRAEIDREVGGLRAKRGEAGKARRSFTAALERFAKLGAVREVEAVRAELESLG